MNWQDYYKNNEEITSDIPIIKNLLQNKKMKVINDCLKNSTENIYPLPKYLFYAFELTPFENIKVVILGQDPYFNEINGTIQAMGLSFSVPDNIPIPSSLKNIYLNMIKYGHKKEFPKSGNLEYLAQQGCLMINTSLTVYANRPNSHTKMWEWFTDEIIDYISENKDNVVFVLWGNPSLKKMPLIDDTKHKIIISSHPSGLSCNKALRCYPAFMDNDHFGQINEFLIKNGKSPIIW